MGRMFWGIVNHMGFLDCRIVHRLACADVDTA